MTEGGQPPQGGAGTWLGRLRGLDGEKLLMRALAAWLLASLWGILQAQVGFDVLDFVSGVNIGVFFLIFAGVFLVLTVLGRIGDWPVDAWAFALSALAYGGLIAARNRNVYFGLGVILTLTFIGYYLLRDDKLGLGKLVLSRRAAIGVIAGAAAFFALYVGGLTTLRYLNYSTSTYDFGIFAQMFHHMKETFLPNTTCERNVLLSHFAVHLSPIYYLLLPGYWLFPSPVYLQVMQGLVVASGIVPLFLLARHFSLSYKMSAALGVVYALYPALAGGCFYDIHENMFLTPLLLWTVYFLEKKRWPLTYFFALLTCMVKEDAPVYVACVALFLLFSRKDVYHGLMLFLGAVAYFCGALALLQMMGQGAMVGRFDNFISDSNLGLLSVFKTLLVNPAYLINEVFNEEKLKYMLVMLLPVACLPLLSRKLTQLFLVVPFLLINLMSDYVYQHSVVFQYNFGTIALFFYLVVINLAEARPRFRRYVVPFMATAAAVLFFVSVGGYTNNIETYLKNREQNQRMDQYLETIPEDASVQATGYLVPKLSGRMILYDYSYNQDSETPHETEYMVFDLRPGRERAMESAVKRYLDQGYEAVVHEKDLVAILRKAGTEASE